VEADLILLDIEMPGMDGFEALRRLKSDARFADVPVIFLTAKCDNESEHRGLAMGAVDFVVKPFRAHLLQSRIENHILLSEQRKRLAYYNAYLKREVYRKAGQILDLQNTMLITVSEMVEFRDQTTGGHIERTQRYLEYLVDELIHQEIYSREMEGWDMKLFITSAPLHDAGKIAISDSILNKPGRLTHDEFELMKKHVDYGVEAIEKIARNAKQSDFLEHARLIAGTHHERWDGSGYPKGLSGMDIPLQGRLMAVADVYDALISERPYKQPLPPSEAERIIVEGCGTHFDPHIVDAFRGVVSQFAEIATANMANYYPRGR
jgi:putative two-component system response regulator